MIGLMELVRKMPGTQELQLYSRLGIPWQQLHTTAFWLITQEREKPDIWRDGKVDQIDVDGGVVTVWVYF